MAGIFVHANMASADVRALADRLRPSSHDRGMVWAARGAGRPDDTVIARKTPISGWLQVANVSG